MRKKQPFNILHVREYEIKGEKRRQYTNIGVAFEVEGGFALEINEGLALTGRALILPRKSKAEGGTDEPEEVKGRSIMDVWQERISEARRDAIDNGPDGCAACEL